MGEWQGWGYATATLTTIGNSLWGYKTATLITIGNSLWGYATVSLISVDDSEWAFQTAQLIPPGVPNIRTRDGEIPPDWAVTRGGAQTPIVWWGIVLNGSVVPLVHHNGSWTPAILTAGADPIGTSRYQLPVTGGLYVSPSGSDTAAGTVTAPLRTLSAALGRATAGTTIVMRAGIYREGGIEAGAKTGVTVQNYPGEVVWFDGTTPLTGWVADGSMWTAPYQHAFDRQLGVGSRISFWSGEATRVIVDQVWVDDIKLTPLTDGSTPTAGQFSVDRDGGRLRIGTDPTGKTVRVATRHYLLAASGITLRGLGIRRYAPTVLEWRGGALNVLDGATIEHCIVEHSSIDGILTFGGCTIRSCTVQDVGHTGIQSDHGNGGCIETSIIRRCNRAGYDPEPTSAGIKVGRTFDGITIAYNHISEVPDCSAIWLDTTVSRSRIIGNTISGTSTIGQGKYGIEIESADGGYYDGVQYWHYVVGNRISNFRQAGVIALNSGYIKIWANFISAAVCVWAWQDYRQNTGTKVVNEGTIEQSPWHTHHIEVVNNILVPEPLYNCQIRGECSSDAPFKIAGGAMFSRIAGNWVRPQGAGLFAYLSNSGGSSWSIRSTITALENTTPEYGGPLSPIMSNNHQQTTAPTANAEPLAADVARAVGAPTGHQITIGPIRPDLLTR